MAGIMSRQQAFGKPPPLRGPPSLYVRSRPSESRRVEHVRFRKDRLAHGSYVWGAGPPQATVEKTEGEKAEGEIDAVMEMPDLPQKSARSGKSDQLTSCLPASVRRML